MNPYTAAKSLNTLTLKKKEYSSLNFPGTLVFEVKTTTATIAAGSYFEVRFPGYYDNFVGVGITCSDAVKGTLYKCVVKFDRILQIISTQTTFKAGDTISIKISGINFKIPDITEVL